MFRNISESIKSSIEIKQSEKKLFRLLYLHSFLIGLSSAFFFVEASRNFILKINIAEIPVAYIMSGVTGYMLIRLFKFWQRKFGPTKSFELTLFLFCSVMILLFAGRLLWDENVLLAKVIAYLGFVLIFAFVTLFSVGFAGICLSIFNLSQSKRLLALLGTGEIIASILGFLIIPFLVNAMGSSSYLLILSAVFSLIAIIPIRKVELARPARPVNKKSSQAPSSFNLAVILKNPFILYLSLTTLFSIVTVYFIDYSYLISVRYFSSVTGVEIATVVAMLFSVIKTGELFFSFFSSNIISAGGMKRSVLLLPLLLIGGAVLGGFSLIVFSESPIFIIFFLFINKWTDRVVRKGVTIPTTKIMFQINTLEERVQLQNNIDGVISQLSTIICGVLLVGVCYFTDTTDYNTFLKVTTIVGLLVFISFLLFSSKLYSMYKVRIQEYLKRSQVVNPVIGDNSANAVYGTLKFNNDDLYSQKFQVLVQETDLLSKEKIRSLICYYNPSAQAYLNFSNEIPENEEEILRKITKLYFENQNMFSRVLIISYFACFDFKRQIIFFKDIEKVTPLRLRAYFLKRLCDTGQIIDESHVFYFSELVAESVNEILWSEAAIEDLKELPDTRLVHQLGLHREELTQVLLHLIELLHDKQSVSLVRDIINNKDRNEDDLLFVVELLENILRPELKKMVLPIFEPISPATRRNRLQKIFFFHSQMVNDRLLDILMHDFNAIDSYPKQLALEALKKIDRDSMVIKAFRSSRIDNLQFIANLEESESVSIASNQQRYTITTHLCNSFLLDDIDKMHIARWGFKDCVGASQTSNIKEDSKKLLEGNLARITNDSLVNHFWEIDLLAPVLLHKIRTA